MTEKERVELLFTGVYFKCCDCGRPCIGEPVTLEGFRYSWCEECGYSHTGAYLKQKRYLLPLKVTE